MWPLITQVWGLYLEAYRRLGGYQLPSSTYLFWLLIQPAQGYGLSKRSCSVRCMTASERTRIGLVFCIKQKKEKEIGDYVSIEAGVSGPSSVIAPLSHYHMQAKSLKRVRHLANQEKTNCLQVTSQSLKFDKWEPSRLKLSWDPGCSTGSD